MDATFHIKQLNLIFSQHKLLLAKTLFFEFSGKMKQEWLLAIPFSELSYTPVTLPSYLKYSVTTGVPRVNNRSLFSKKLMLLTIKN
ncbi:hypothetical protein SAMN05444280_14321 [Tangfeifania diversioriginum]|uniref:Uncharacterized protein n=1 Tax=Tangfeifania diversioriginum TaxID=1168035 RepID=A0A1M6NKY0_9BACT|nr:hypothetical protein SAMN05444280_14321 [Tangfeifania diversioriginum]